MSNIYEEIVRSYYNRSSDQIMSNEQKQFFDNLTLIRILEEKNKELQYKINKAVEYIEEINNRFEEIPDKELLTNRVVDISVLNEINCILKGNNEEDDIKCEICGLSNKTVQYREDPFVKELDNISQYKYMCDKCYENCLYDI